MYPINYTELDWRAAILLGSALQEGLTEAVAKGVRPIGEIASELGLEENGALFQRVRGLLVPGRLLTLRYERWVLRAGFEEVEVSPTPGLQTHLILACNPS